MPSRLSSSTAYPMIARFAARLASLTRIAFAGTLLASTLFAGHRGGAGEPGHPAGINGGDGLFQNSHSGN